MNGPLIVALLVAGAVAGIILTLARVRELAGKANRLDAVLASYARNLGAGEAAELGETRRRRPAWLVKFLKQTDERLAGAGIELPAQTWVSAALVVSAGVALLGGLFFGSWILGVVLGAAAGFYLLNVFLTSRIRAKAVKFSEELPQVLAIIASGLRAGLTFASALSATANQDRGEVGRQLRRALAEVQFGSSIEEALRRVAKRMNSADLEWLVLALEIQREVGGSLSGILDGVATTIKGRAEIRREVRVISSEGRMSGYVLIALPIFSFLSLVVVRPDYVKFFWTDPMGFLLLGISIAMMVVGWLWMTKVVTVRV